MKLINLTKSQSAKFNTILNYLNAKAEPIYLGDNDATYIGTLKSIWISASGLQICGTDLINFKSRTENLYPIELNQIYRACLKDEDFKEWATNAAIGLNK